MIIDNSSVLDLFQEQYISLSDTLIELDDIDKKKVNEFFNYNNSSFLSGCMSLDEEYYNNIKFLYLSESSSEKYKKNEEIAKRNNAVFMMYISIFDTRGHVLRECSKCAKEIVNIIKKYGINDIAKDKCAHVFNKSMEKCVKILDYNRLYKHLEKKGIYEQSDNYRKSFDLLFLVFMVNTIELNILSLFGPIGMFLGCAVLGPINEEIGKQISIRGGFAKEYYIVFNAFEFTLYVLGGTSPILRVPALVLHGITTAVQICHNNPNLLGVDPKDAQKVKERSSFNGALIGILIHGSFNGILTVLSFMGA